MPELIVKEPIPIEPTELDVLKEKVTNLTVVAKQKDAEIKQLQVKTTKRPSIGYFRSRFK